MASAVDAADWVRNERRKQNAVVLLVILACLLVAFFPRNERRLFTFPGAASFMQTITAPVQTRLREGIFGPARLAPSKEQPLRSEMVLPISEPQVDFPAVPWFDELFNAPIQFDAKLPPPAALPDRRPTPITLLRPAPMYFGGLLYTGGAVPEPATWLMLISGLGLIMWQLRASRTRARKRRGHLRWRRNLAPVPIRTLPPLVSD